MTTIKKLPSSQIEISSSISANDLSAYRVQAIKNLNEDVSVKGFRKGKVPENILGDMTILYEMAELAIGDAYPRILEEKKIDAIGRPEVKITKIAKDNPLEFTITTAVAPEVKVGDYKKIAKDFPEVKVDEVTDEEVEKVNIEIEKQHGHKHDIKEIRDSLNAEKKHRAIEKRRLDIAEKILEAVEIDLPRVMIEHELARSEAQFTEDTKRFGVKIEDYLKKLNKNIEDLRKDWEQGAIKKAKLQLVLSEIAKKEKLAPKPEDIEKEVAMILEHYKKADPIQARIYAETVLTNDQVFAFLESL